MTTAISKMQLQEESQVQLRTIVESLVTYINPILAARFFQGGSVNVDEADLINNVLGAPIKETVRQALMDEYSREEAGWAVEHVYDRDGNYFRFS